MNGRRLFAAVVLAGLAVRLAHLVFTWGLPYHDLYTTWTNSDMHQFAAWARHLAGGDWLDIDTFRPYFEWQERIAPPEVWNSWFGAHVYYQPPLYPYLIAAVVALTGSLDAFRLLQLVLGAVNCGLIALLAARLYGTGAAWVAGLGAAVFAPFVMYDAEILRGTVVMTTQIGLLIALAAAGAGRDRQRGGWIDAAAGAVFGIGYLAEPSILLFAPLALAWRAATAWPARGRSLVDAARPVILFAAGASIALSPLLVRNAVVGAPLLSSTTRGPLAFVMGNAPDASPAGAYIPPSTVTILRSSGYRMLPTMLETLRMYRGRYGGLIGKQWTKMKALWGAYEVPDNPSFYYAARVSPVVRYGLRFLPVAAFGLTGLGLSLRGVRREPGRALLPLFILSCIALFLLAHVVSRYRQPMAMALLILAGYAVARVAGAARATRYAPAAAIVGAGLLVMLLLPWSPPSDYGYVRPSEFIIAADLYVERGQTDRAVGEIDALIAGARHDEQFSDNLPEMYYKRGEIQAAAGRHSEAAASFRKALEMDPQYGEAAEALEAETRAIQGEQR